ncbi:hypothetical protein VNO80_19250 [Phaseolus coccineus]|uniref:Uncharacterized protein n=1 Tax=Phaseolus coccineus TaxID=3886 RepID=A0AAN9MLV8_PHACN
MTPLNDPRNQLLLTSSTADSQPDHCGSVIFRHLQAKARRATTAIEHLGRFSASLPIRKLRLSSGIREFGGLKLEERVFTLVQFCFDVEGDVVAGFQNVLVKNPVLFVIAGSGGYEWASRVKENELHLLSGLNGRLV